MKSTINIDNKRYAIDVFMMEPLNDVYRFGVQIWGGGTISPFSMKLPKKFIEEEIGIDKNKNYLESLTLRVAEDHLRDILSLDRNSVAANLIYWFKEAKGKNDKEVKDGNIHKTVK